MWLWVAKLVVEAGQRPWLDDDFGKGNVDDGTRGDRILLLLYLNAETDDDDDDDDDDDQQERVNTVEVEQ